MKKKGLRSARAFFLPFKKTTKKTEKQNKKSPFPFGVFEREGGGGGGPPPPPFFFFFPPPPKKKKSPYPFFTSL